MNYRRAAISRRVRNCAGNFLIRIRKSVSPLRNIWNQNFARRHLHDRRPEVDAIPLNEPFVARL
jgi:hypothetical protein